ncbi:hypothetical protein GE09DRAFT_744351 [Coniochaeta sp. 2T2.1]|nr:hypothetical protein GE09DRAFT_744351 [Coniochaeta sp. 2T2.1]
MKGLVDPDYDCSVSISANTDVGGPGVIISFVVIAGFTVFLASFLALEVLRQWWHSAVKAFKQWHATQRTDEEGLKPTSTHRYMLRRTRTFIGSAPGVTEQRRGRLSAREAGKQPSAGIEPRPRNVDRVTPSQHRPRAPPHPSIREIRDSLFDPVNASRRQLACSPRTRKIATLLRPLCDLQIATGLGMMVAGMGQWHTIDFYHEQLVNSYYALTLNSFWATRVSYMDVESREDTWVLFLRRATVLTSSILNIIWQFRIYYRETASRVWDDEFGPCFRYLDRSDPLFSTIFWTAGLSLFCFALATSLFKQTRWVNEWYFAATEWLSQVLWNWLQAALARNVPDSEHISGAVRALRKMLTFLLKVVEVLASALVVTVYFLVVQLLDVWSYGSGFYPLTWFAYFAFYAWNVFDIVSAVVLNHGLIEDEEWSWGFGQILPLVLILGVLFSAVDVFRASSRPDLDEITGNVESSAGPSTTELLTQKVFVMRQTRARATSVPASTGIPPTDNHGQGNGGSSSPSRP